MGKLQLLAFVHGFASPRRVTMYVKRMVQIGRLKYGARAADRRVRLLTPSDALVQTARRHILLLCRAADVLAPDRDLGTKILADEDYFFRLFLEMGQAYVQGADPTRPFDDVRHFTSKDAGTLLLNILLSECLEGRPGLSPATEFAINYSEIARSGGVSRTHVRNVMKSAAARACWSSAGKADARCG